MAAGESPHSPGERGDILDAAGRIARYVAGKDLAAFESDDLTLDAVSHCFGIIGAWPVKFGSPECKEVPLSEVRHDLPRYLREAKQGPIVIARHGKAAGVLIGFGCVEPQRTQSEVKRLLGT